MWERSRADKARTLLRWERETTEAKFASVIGTLPVLVVVTNREPQIIAYSEGWAQEVGGERQRSRRWPSFRRGAWIIRALARAI